MSLHICVAITLQVLLLLLLLLLQLLLQQLLLALHSQYQCDHRQFVELWRSSGSSGWRSWS